MSRTGTIRKYGKTKVAPQRRAEELFAQLPRTHGADEAMNASEVELAHESRSVPRLAAKTKHVSDTEPALKSTEELEVPPALDGVSDIVDRLETVHLEDPALPPKNNSKARMQGHTPIPHEPTQAERQVVSDLRPPDHSNRDDDETDGRDAQQDGDSCCDGLRVLCWDDVCPPGDSIEKIAEASYAEVYRITNAHGTSIIKVIRLESPIKAQTKAQQRSGLVDEEPRSEEDMEGELQISEWLSDIPGFVVFKERYLVEGKAPKALVETHQAFHRRMKRKDPDRLQYYPSPSRYLDETRFMVVELGDAGTALEDFPLTSISQVWDVFLHTALALARAEDLAEFEHRDLHEGNICIRQARPPITEPPSERPTTTTTPHPGPLRFGASGLDVTLLDYGLSRAVDPNDFADPPRPSSVIANDLERDLSIFQSTHAPQCRVYRQMRSFLVHGDRCHVMPPEQHSEPYPAVVAAAAATGSSAAGAPISWRAFQPYTNVLWLAYLYDYLVSHFRGSRKELAWFRRETAELWEHLDPDAPREVLSFPCAGAVVGFAVEAGWVEVRQLEDVWGEQSQLG